MTYLVRAVLLASAGVGAALSLAAPPPGKRRNNTKKPPKRPMVMVSCKDGTTVRGTIESADPERIVVKAVPKGETVEVPWDNITRVSNGLTREKVIAQYRKEHPEHICKDCGGDGMAACASCH